MVAERKVRGLLATGATVVVIAPHLTPGLRALVDVGSIAVEQRRYIPGDLAGATLAFAATDQCAVNAAVAAEAREVGALVNVADAPGEGDFTVPAVARRGALTVGVSTAGESPVVAALVRDQVAEWLDGGMAKLLELVAAVRREGLAAGQRHSAEHWRAALDASVLALAREDRLADAEVALRRALQGKRASGAAPSEGHR